MIAPVEAAARAAAEVPALEPGVSRELARWRAARLRDIRYALWIDLSADGPALDARLEIRFNLDARTDLVLDWRAPSPRHPAQMPEAISANGRALAGARMVSEHLVIPARALRRGANRLSMRVRSPVAAAGTAVTRFVDREDGAHYLYTLLVPAEASTLFPCFDQPDLKARLRLTLTAPAGWRAVSNAPLARSGASQGRVRLRFGETEPLSTYQFAFAAGPFEELIESAAPRAAAPGPVRLYVRRSKIEAARREAPDLLRLNREALGWYTRYFARAFPFAKYDLVLVPELAYGGMEHSGATFLREESVLFPFEPAATDRLRRAQLVLHETAHQWFGDLVTMRWFDDLWLKEGFANFMAAKAGAELVRRRVPEIHPWVAFGALKLAAYRTDATPGTTPIWRELGNLADAKSAYGAIVYSKAPAVLRQAEYYVGERAFRRALRAFLSRHAHGVADWSDLVAALEKASGRPLAAWAEAWVKRRGMARVRLERGADAISLTQENLLGEAQLWPMRLKLVALAGGRHSVHPLRLAGARTDLGLAGAAGADFLFANFEDYGYGQFLLDPQSLEYALAHPEALQDELLRAQVFDSLWESVREAQLDPRRYIELALAWLPRERDDTTATLLLARLSSAYLRYSGAQAQRAFAPAVEALLLSGLSGSGSASRRIAYLRALVETARSSAARARLRALYAGTQAIEGVPLRSRDRFRIASALLALGEPDALRLIADEVAREAGSEAQRYAFAAAAASPEPAAKAAYFRRFLTDQTLPESWIEEALVPFNAPEHEAATLPFLEQALQALPRLKRERRIFFVNGWLAAFLDGQSSPAALATVERFLASAELEPDLRLKVLEALDALARTVRIRGKFAG